MSLRSQPGLCMRRSLNHHARPHRSIVPAGQESSSATNGKTKSGCPGGSSLNWPSHPIERSAAKTRFQPHGLFVDLADSCSRNSSRMPPWAQIHRSDGRQGSFRADFQPFTDASSLQRRFCRHKNTPRRPYGALQGTADRPAGYFLDANQDFRGRRAVVRLGPSSFLVFRVNAFAPIGRISPAHRGLSKRTASARIHRPIQSSAHQEAGTWLPNRSRTNA